MPTYGEVTNFNAINTPTITSTGTVTLTGALSLTGDLTLTGDLNVIDAHEAVAGATDPLASTADLDNVSYQAVTSTSGALKKYLLATPVAGARKTIYNATPDSTGTVYIYASASSAYTAHFGVNTSGNVLQLAQAGGCIITLIGVSTAKWLVQSISTLNVSTTGTCVIGSSNT